MVQDAKRNESADIKRKELIEARNIGDQVAYQAEKSLKDLGEKVSGADRGEAEAKISDLRDALKTDDITRIKKATDALQQTLMKIGQASYGTDDTNGNANGSTGNGKHDDGVVEGEYRSV
jgi:molecular chaperone DnaK